MSNSKLSSLLGLVYTDIKYGVAKANEKLHKLLEIHIRAYLEKEKARFQYSKNFLHRVSLVEFYSIFEPPSIRIGRSAAVSTAVVGHFLKKGDRFAICGEAGSGKTTLLRHVFMSILESGDSIPVFIELREISRDNEKPIDFTQIIEERLTIYKKAGYAGVFASLATKGRLALLFDGLDEIEASSKQEFFQYAAMLQQVYPMVTILVTSRPNSGLDMMSGLVSCDVASFTSSQIISFIKKQGLDKEMENKLILSIKQSEDAGISAFLSNPLLLSLYILTFASHASIPQKRSTFYRRVIDTLYSEHDSLSKLGYDRPKKTGLIQDEFESIVGKFSLITFLESKFVFDKQLLDAIFGKIREMETHSIRDLMSDLVSAVGIWTEDAGHYQFCHRSIQEYFAAFSLNRLAHPRKEAVYAKLLDPTARKSGMLGFLSLCEELDEYYYLKFFQTKLLSSLRINSSEEDDDVFRLKLLFGKAIRAVKYGWKVEGAPNGPLWSSTASIINDQLILSIVGEEGRQYLELISDNKKLMNFIKANKIDDSNISSVPNHDWNHNSKYNPKSMVTGIVDFSLKDAGDPIFEIIRSSRRLRKAADAFFELVVSEYEKSHLRLKRLEDLQNSFVNLII